MKCSRCSGEGKAERDLGHTAPAVTPPRHNLRQETRQRQGARETGAGLIEFILHSFCYQTHLE